MFLFGLAGETGGFDPLILLLLALCLESLLGSLIFPAAPGAATLAPLGRLADWFERKLNRENRSTADRAMRGAMVVLFFLVVALGLGLAIAWASQNLPFAWLLELALLVTLIAQRGLFHGVRRVGGALRAGELDRAREAAGRLADHDVGRLADHDVGRLADHGVAAGGVEQLEAHGLARRAIEACAGNFLGRVVAPVFYYTLFGFPGLLAYRALALLGARIGRPGEKYRAFGFTASRMAGVLDLIPAQLAGGFIVLAALFVPTARPGQAWKAMRAVRGQSKPLLRGLNWPLAAMGGALDLALSKAGGINGRASWIGSGWARATHRDVSRALYVFGVACLINAAWVGALTVVRFT